MNLAVSQTETDEYEKDQKAAAFFNSWKKALIDYPGIDQEEGIGRNESYCAFAYFPEEIMNWTEGDLADNDFAYALNDEQERKALEFCKKCAEVIANNEELLDAMAKGN